MSAEKIDLSQTKKTLFSLLKPDSSIFWVVTAYSVVIGLLTLAVPIAVQTLINTIANIASTRAVIILGIVLFTTLILSGLFSALRTRVMEYYERRVYARLVAELGVRTILAPQSHFSGRRNISITNRYFDIMTLQKNVPSLMVDGIALLLQMVVGFTLVSFYHPFLFAFNVGVIFIMFVIWRGWSRQAKTTAIKLSACKYDTAKWLDNLAAAHQFTKSSSQFDYAGKKTDRYVSDYNAAHLNHFSFTFKQVVSFLVLYALASAALLGLGGWLVISGQLSIGQLVAAELIMAAVFIGVSRFSLYLKIYYELYGSADKIGAVFNIPQELPETTSKPKPESGALHFNNVAIAFNDQVSIIDKKIEEGGKFFIDTQSSWTQRSLINILKCFESPASGWVNVGESDISDYDTYELRQAIFVLDRSLIIECTIAEYIKMCAPEATTHEIKSTLSLLGLSEFIQRLPLAMDTPLSSVGAPLQPLEFIFLKLVVAILSKPKILIINQHFDTIPTKKREAVLALIEKTNITVLYFSNAPVLSNFDGVIKVNTQPQQSTSSEVFEQEDKS